MRDPGDLDLRGARRASAPLLERCPWCRSDALVPVSDGETVNFRCEDCGRCWHVALRCVSRVDPATCGGCPARSRCRTVYGADHPESLLA